MSQIFFYNTLTRKKELFIPSEPGKVKLYTCGPTVYNFAHIGNMRSFVFYDFLRRTLEYLGFKVTHVMNITDVGHLTSDEDFGEDKLEKGAVREGKTVWEVADRYLKAFQDDAKKLNILPPTFMPRATEHIKEQIEFIKELEKNGYIYKTKEALYFDVTRFEDYTRLSGQKLEEKFVGVRSDVVEDREKKHPADFAVWFFLVGKFANHSMHWPSPWGEGFPGWHIECSAMGTKYLGNTIDIHTGGIDHISVHHTNERAQNFGRFRKEVVRFWIHHDHVQLSNGEKMAKSGGDFITLSALEEKGFSSLALRYLFLTAHYRTKMEFRFEALEAAERALENLFETFLEYEEKDVLPDVEYQNEFKKYLENDLDTPRALALAWKLIKDTTIKNPIKRATLLDFDRVFGLGLKDYKKAKAKIIPEEIIKLAKARFEARMKKDFFQADILRKEIEARGFSIEDTSEGFIIEEKKNFS